VAAPDALTGGGVRAGAARVRRPEERACILGSAFGMLAGATAIAIAAPIAIVAVLRPGEREVLIVSAVLACSFAPNAFFVIEHLFKSEVKARQVATARTCAMAVSNAAKIALVLNEAPIAYVAAAVALETCTLTAIYCGMYLRSERGLGRWRFTWSEAAFVFRQSLPAMAASVAVTFFFRISQINLGQIAGYAEVAQYAVAFQLMQVVWMAPSIFFSAVYPRMVQIDAEAGTAMAEMNRKLLLGFAVFSYAVAAALIAFGGPILTLAFGTAFAGSAPTLAILAAATAFVCSGAVRGRFIFLQNAPIYHLYNTGIGLAVLLPLNFFLIPRYGAVGAAASVAVGLLVSAVLTSFVFAKTRAFGREQAAALLLLPLFSAWRRRAAA